MRHFLFSILDYSEVVLIARFHCAHSCGWIPCGLAKGQNGDIAS
jgi:hypothetical protein